MDPHTGSEQILLKQTRYGAVIFYPPTHMVAKPRRRPIQRGRMPSGSRFDGFLPEFPTAVVDGYQGVRSLMCVYADNGHRVLHLSTPK
jgi:hypothetical protein